MKITWITYTVAITLSLIWYVTPCVAQTTVAVSPAAMSSAPTYSLTVVVSDVHKRTGKISVGLVNSAENFEGESYQTQAVDVSVSGEISVVFDSLTAGRYAVRLYQDINGNGKIDFNGQMPTEPFGFSNLTIPMGPPSFSQCAFDLAENKRIQVGLIDM